MPDEIKPGEWTYTIKATRQDVDTLWTDVVYSNGTATEAVAVPSFQPQTADDVFKGVNNRGLTVQQKYNASDQVALIKPDVDKEKDKPTPIKATDTTVIDATLGG